MSFIGRKDDIIKFRKRLPPRLGDITEEHLEGLGHIFKQSLLDAVCMNPNAKEIELDFCIRIDGEQSVASTKFKIVSSELRLVKI